MKSLIRDDDWLKDTVSDQDIANWNPEFGDCCTADAFRLHLAGTTCNRWNESATRVFASDFLTKNADTYPDGWTVRSMVLKKTRAYIKTLIKKFRDHPSTQNEESKAEKKRVKNRRERKANVSTEECSSSLSNSWTTQLFYRRRDITFVYPQMEPQRRMLDELGIDGMSSDEGEKVNNGIQYRIYAPRWRARMVTPWLRVFDSLYLDYRMGDNSGDQRGTLPRRRVPTRLESSSRKYVPGLPINAYRTDWLEEQLDITNLVHPAPAKRYQHDPDLFQYVSFPPPPHPYTGVAHALRGWPIGGWAHRSAALLVLHPSPGRLEASP